MIITKNSDLLVSCQIPKQSLNVASIFLNYSLNLAWCGSADIKHLLQDKSSLCFLQTATFLKFCNLGNFREEGVQQKLQKMWLPLIALLRDCGMKSPQTSYAIFVLLLHADTRLQSKMVETTLNDFLDYLQLTFDIILIVVYVMYSMFSTIRRLRLI